jgi:hypothetical protein
LNALDPRLVEDAANRLDTDEGLVEKDWHVVRAIGVIAALDSHRAIKRRCASMGGFKSFSIHTRRKVARAR